jgi:hypothetical protein
MPQRSHGDAGVLHGDLATIQIAGASPDLVTIQIAVRTPP